MNDLSVYIHHLLYTYDCVIIPNFGGFITKKMQAGVDDTNQRFFPPRKNVAFNASLNQNDGLLANFIAVKQSVTYNQALTIIDEFVDQIHVQLKLNSSYSITGIGLFKLTQDKSILFEPDVYCNFLVDTYGMGVINSLPIKREPIKRESTIVDRPAIKTDQPVVQIPGRIKWASAIVVPLLFVLMLGVFNQSVLKGVYTNYTNVVTSFVDFGDYLIHSWKTLKDSTGSHNQLTKQTDDTLLIFSEASVTTKGDVTENTEAIEKPIQAIVPSTKTVAYEFVDLTGKTLVIAGCFGVLDNAKGLIAELREKGFDARLAGTSANGLNRVAVGAFVHRKDAETLMVEFKSKGYAAWISEN